MFQKTVKYINERLIEHYYDLIDALARDEDVDDIIDYVSGEGCGVIYNYLTSLERETQLYNIAYAIAHGELD